MKGDSPGQVEAKTIEIIEPVDIEAIRRNWDGLETELGFEGAATRVAFRLCDELEAARAVIDKLPAWADDLGQIQNQLHGVRGGGTAKINARSLEHLVRKAMRGNPSG